MKLSHTHVVFITSLGFALAAIAALVVLLLIIQTRGETLESYVTAIGDQLAQEKKYTELQSLVDDTSAERNELGQYILTEDETISFLTTIEDVGRRQGVTFTTNSLNAEGSPDDSFQKLVAQFTITGGTSQINQIIQILETMPYHSELTNLDWRLNQDGDVGTLIVAVAVSMKNHDQ